MPSRLLICSDLDRTLLPNGAEPESPGARAHFARLAARPETTVAYVSGRHRELVENAIAEYSLPRPDFVVGDVGTTIYRIGPDGEWAHLNDWEAQIAFDWKGLDRVELEQALVGLKTLRLQEANKQNRFKLSYYLPVDCDRTDLGQQIDARLDALGVRARLVWSVDEPAATGLLDVLPASASKLHAIEALGNAEGYAPTETVFCGDSGNDLEVLASAIPAVLVANYESGLAALAQRLADENGHGDRLYVARGDFMGMNGNYAAGVLEGIAHYHPAVIAWMGFESSEKSA